LNIAEGNGKSWAKERSRFMEIARGSAVECAACLDVFVVKRLIDIQTATYGKKMLYEVVCMLTGLINSLGTHIAEEEAEYRLEYRAD
jgi:four helix bundle protein